MQQQDIMNNLQSFIGSSSHSEEDFNHYALQLFEYQYKNNLPFRNYCMQKRKTLRTVKSWKDIPAVPINAFKETSLTCIDTEQAERTFMTSGTTKGVKGKHYHPNLEIWNLSMKSCFKRSFMKDEEKVHMGILFPTEEEMPNSSLAHYLSLAMKGFGTEDSNYLLSENGILLDLLIQEMEHAEQTGKPYALLGASFSFVQLFEELAKVGRSFNLPMGSRILDTGGFKNQSREMDLDEFYNQLTTLFGIARKDCINMYGMTELSTQLYDHGNEHLPSIKFGPHWVKTRVINPLTGEDVGLGERGVIVHCDLANFNSVTTVMTEDLGIKVNNGFQLLGRVQGTEAKGCSIAVEEFISASKGKSI
jgi:hypothetical protein